MGRPRKQPRRIMTFNLNADLAQRIDDLNLSNRSEWANGVFLEVMDDRLARRQGQQIEDIKRAKERTEDAIMESLSQDPHRLAVMLMNALINTDMAELKVYGRRPLYDHLVLAVQSGELKFDADAYMDSIEALKARLSGE